MARLEEVNPGAGHTFGYDVGIDETNLRVVVGAPANSAINVEVGAANIFWSDDGGSSWTGYEIQLDAVMRNDRFGEAVDITDKFAIVGAPYRDTSDTNTGAALIFELSPSHSV
eukprot:11831113-Prorocentrum_lima.AAC.1